MRVGPCSLDNSQELAETMDKIVNSPDEQLNMERRNRSVANKFDSNLVIPRMKRDI